jgi:hypothetical protein
MERKIMSQKNTIRPIKMKREKEIGNVLVCSDIHENNIIEEISVVNKMQLVLIFLMVK